ncbi:hypothetical protein ACQCPK_07730 [Proteus mirabilis]|uniref:hypothetical protein n=1 Tax=Proteus mirabilis TaxID=584 RepID=UPI0016272577|nr:hypothetical protein [Proteus mirabilis]MBB6658520.1 hypothetical protein [Proteus mirabilis]MBG2713793.1 hypothetical protein [Proteus mirabilis]
MTTVFIAGSIKITKLDKLVIERVRKIVDSGYQIVVGDANGVDSSIQKLLMELNSNNTTVFSSGTYPRNNLGKWSVHVVNSKHSPGSRAFFTDKDIKMAEIADYGLMIWDSQSIGTLSNVIELLRQKKFSAIFVNKVKTFELIKNTNDLKKLISHMSPNALEKAEQKIKLSQKLEQLDNNQIQMVL